MRGPPFDSDPPQFLLLHTFAHFHIFPRQRFQTFPPPWTFDRGIDIRYDFNDDDDGGDDDDDDDDDDDCNHGDGDDDDDGGDDNDDDDGVGDDDDDISDDDDDYNDYKNLNHLFKPASL